jgi:hypothetical protein
VETEFWEAESENLAIFEWPSASSTPSATLIGGAGAPALFGALIESNSRLHLVWRYFAAAVFIVVTAITEAILGVAAEGQSLEKISKPLSWK